MPQAPRHRRENPDDAASDEELLALCFDEIIAGIDKHRHTFAVAGTAESSSGRFREMAFTPGSEKAHSLFKPLEVVEFTAGDSAQWPCNAVCGDTERP